MRLLDRLNGSNSTGIAFQRLWQRTCETIEAAFGDVFRALANMPDIPGEEVFADFGGTVITGQLPRYIRAYRYTGSIDDTANATWSFSVDTGDLTGSISNGLLEITALGQTSKVTVSSVFNGVTTSKSFTVAKKSAAPTSNSTSFGWTNEFQSFTGSTAASIMSGEIDVTTGSAGAIMTVGELLFYTDAAPPTGSFALTLQWYNWTGAAWVPFATAYVPYKNLIVTALPGGGYLVDAGRCPAGIGAITLGLPVSTAMRFKLYASASVPLSQTIYFVGQVGVAAS